MPSLMHDRHPLRGRRRGARPAQRPIRVDLRRHAAGPLPDFGKVFADNGPARTIRELIWRLWLAGEREITLTSDTGSDRTVTLTGVGRGGFHYTTTHVGTGTSSYRGFRWARPAGSVLPSQINRSSDPLAGDRRARRLRDEIAALADRGPVEIVAEHADGSTEHLTLLSASRAGCRCLTADGRECSLMYRSSLRSVRAA